MQILPEYPELPSVLRPFLLYRKPWQSVWVILQTQIGIVHINQICSSPYGDFFLVSIENSAGSHVTGLVQLAQSCDQAGHFRFQYMISVIELTLNDYAVAFHFDFLCIGDNRDSQMFGNLRSYLCGITIDSLTACDDQIIFQIADSSGNCLGGCPCISAAQYSVSYENTRYLRPSP